jgi:hypothetical protein
MRDSALWMAPIPSEQEPAQLVGLVLVVLCSTGSLAGWVLSALV